jgi:hypothetical protein
MKKRTLLLSGLVLLAVCLVALGGCTPPMSPLGSASSDGSVVLSFSDARARTIAPPAESLTVATYQISFTRSGQPRVPLSVPGGTIQTEPIYLKPGNWTVTLSAENSTGDAIGVASDAVTVVAGHTSTLTLIILSLQGKGTLTLDADTSDLAMSDLSLTGFLVPGVGGDPIPVSFTMGDQSAGYSDLVPAGSYRLDLVLKDGAQVLGSYVDTVLVVARLSTTSSLGIKARLGAVVIELEDQILRPIPINLSGAQATLSGGATMTVTATPAVPVDSYQWYLDGEAIRGATANQVTVGSGLEEGEHRLTVVVKKGSLYSSESVGFTVTVTGPTVYAGGACANISDNSVAGYWKDGAWVELTNPYGSQYGAGVNSLVVSGSEVWAGGYSASSGTAVAGYWKDGAWVGLTSPSAGAYVSVRSLVVTSSDVYAGVSGIVVFIGFADYYKNGAVVELTSPYGGPTGMSSLVVSGSDVYVGGEVSASTWTGPWSAGYWKSGTWVGFTNPYGSYNAYVNSLAVSGFDVYAGGYTYNSPDTWVAGYWKSGAWVGLTNPYGSYKAQVTSLVVSGFDVYAGGYSAGSSFDYAGYWKNGTWVELTNPYGPYNAHVNSLVVSGPDVYAGGVCFINSSTQVAGYWKNGAWVGFINPYGPYSASVGSLVVSGQ